jgi:prepilin peptidase CpaA
VHPFISDPIASFLSVALILAAIKDIQFRRIPNLLNFLVIGLSFFYHGWFHGLDGFLFSASGMLLGVALLIGPYLLGGMGAGDAKLMGAVGAALGPKGVFISFLYSAIVGGFYAGILLLVYRTRARAIMVNMITGIKSLVYTRQWVSESTEHYEKSPRLCYGLAIALGTIIYMALERMGYSLFHGFMSL